MAVFKRGGVWWFKFRWRGRLIRESTKQSNKRVAGHIEAARKTALAKGEVGIRDRKPAPTLKDFLDEQFLPWVRSTKKEKERTVNFYEFCAANLKGYKKLASARLDEIDPPLIQAFTEQRQQVRIERRQGKLLEVSSINRDLATLRRALRCAADWDVIPAAPKVHLLAGEKQRERALVTSEVEAYLSVATDIAHSLERDYDAALRGIRAAMRGKQPIKPDAYRLLDRALLMLDAGLRPEECEKLTRENVRDGAIWIDNGKTPAARRRIPIMTGRLRAALDMRMSQAEPGAWLFPAPTKSGHMEESTLKGQHSEALANLKATGVLPFEPYVLRHTCLTEWAKWMDVPTLKKLAGHSSLSTTMRYIHVTDEHVDRMVKAHEARTAPEVRSRHKSGHSDKNHTSDSLRELPVID